VLDLGSGPGDGSALLADAGAIVDGVDFSSRMVAVARQRHPRIQFHEADAEHLPFGNGTFDAVVSNCVVHHLARPAAVFEEVSRVLVPGGRLAFSVWGAAEEQTGFGVFFAAVQAHHELQALPQGPLFGVTDPAVYKALTDGAGLGDFGLRRHEIAWRMNTIDHLVAGPVGLGNIDALPETYPATDRQHDPIECARLLPGRRLRLLALHSRRGCVVRKVTARRLP
jgi:SAM-dependent methyltransferase